MAPPDLTDLFFLRWANMCSRLRVDPFDLIRVAYSESAVRANAHNKHGNASGLIQFMPDTLKGLGWTKGHEAFRLLPAEEQVEYVERYMRPHAPWCRSDALCYVAVFLPALGARAVEMGDQYVLCGQRGPLAWAYAANRVLDKDQNGTITVADLGKQIESQCRGTRWDAIHWRLRQAMGLQPPPIPEPPDTQPDITTTATEPTIAPPPLPEEVTGSGPTIHKWMFDDEPPDDAA